MDPLPADIETRLSQDYPVESLPAVSCSLATYLGSERDRVIRCIIHLSAGDPQRVSYYLGIATQDYRDVIYWAEYDKDDRRVRDFNRPFLPDFQIAAGHD